MRASEGESARPEGGEQYLDGLLTRVARGDQAAFEDVYDTLAGPIYGLINRVVRDPAQSEEVCQEVFLEVWRTASRFDPGKGAAATWAMTIAHRRAVDRVRSAAASTARANAKLSATVESPDTRATTRPALARSTSPRRPSIDTDGSGIADPVQEGPDARRVIGIEPGPPLVDVPVHFGEDLLPPGGIDALQRGIQLR